MLPEILNVSVEGGEAVFVPLTPVTTFKDVSACVREPGDPLPLILEESPLGARVVPGWERPLELLRLWGEFRNQVKYNASFSLSRQLRDDSYLKSDTKVLSRSVTPDCTSVKYGDIDPWELYELRDDLKDLLIHDLSYLNESSSHSESTEAFDNGEKLPDYSGGQSSSGKDHTINCTDVMNMGFISNYDFSKDLTNHNNSLTKTSPADNRSQNIESNKENEGSVEETDESHLFWTSFNSHTKDKRYRKRFRRSHMTDEEQNDHLQSLLRESRLASINGGSPFRRGSKQTCSFPSNSSKLYDFKRLNDPNFEKKNRINGTLSSSNTRSGLSKENNKTVSFSNKNIYSSYNTPNFIASKNQGISGSLCKEKEGVCPAERGSNSQTFVNSAPAFPVSKVALKRIPKNPCRSPDCHERLLGVRQHSPDVNVLTNIPDKTVVQKSPYFLSSVIQNSLFVNSCQSNLDTQHKSHLQNVPTKNMFQVNNSSFPQSILSNKTITQGQPYTSSNQLVLSQNQPTNLIIANRGSGISTKEDQKKKLVNPLQKTSHNLLSPAVKQKPLSPKLKQKNMSPKQLKKGKKKLDEQVKKEKPPVQENSGQNKSILSNNVVRKAQSKLFFYNKTSHSNKDEVSNSSSRNDKPEMISNKPLSQNQDQIDKNTSTIAKKGLLLRGTFFSSGTSSSSTTSSSLSTLGSEPKSYRKYMDSVQEKPDSLKRISTIPEETVKRHQSISRDAKPSFIPHRRPTFQVTSSSSDILDSSSANDEDGPIITSDEPSSFYRRGNVPDYLNRSKLNKRDKVYYNKMKTKNLNFRNMLKEVYPKSGTKQTQDYESRPVRSTKSFKDSSSDYNRFSQRRSRARQRISGADHRRSYSDPSYEHLEENLNMERRRRHSGGGIPASDEGMKDSQSHLQLIPDSGDLTVNELREMATRQQQHIENQQQLLVAREQRLKYLKQQEGRTSQVNMETERLRRLRERVEAQEAKLRRLRALRGQVDNSRLNAASLYSDLDAMRHLFSEKEKELVDAAAKVEELTRQLEDVRGGRGAGGSGAQNGGLTNSNQLQIHHQELEKLRRELLYRNSVNREASSRVSSQKDALTSRKEEISRIDKRIAELTQRLHRKRVLNQQLTTQISAATQAKQAQLKAVQQKALRDGKNDHSADNVNIEEHRTLEDISQFDRGKHDPKYQTLPYNTKFSSGVKGGPVSGPRGSYDNAGSENESNGSSSDTNPSQSASVVNNIRNSGLVTSTTSTTSAPSINNVGNSNNNSAGLITRTVHSIPAHLAPKGHALAPGSNQGGPPTYPPPAPVVHNSLAKGQTSNSVGLISSNQQNLSSSQLYQQKVQSETGQPVSVSNPVQKFYPPHQQNRNTVLPSTHATPNTINKDVENVRALGYPAGSSNVPSSQSATSAYYPPASNSSNSHLLASSSVSSKPYSSAPVISMSSMTEQQQDDSPDQCVGKLKPILPPKPVVPSKPTPPPRQKGDPMASSTESINLIGVSNHRTSSSIRPHVFRYASQNVILSTYTQQQQQNNQQQVSATRESQSNKSTSVANNNNHEKQNHETSKGKPISKDGPAVMESTEDNLPPAEKVHISINRRIEMPPDFLFPEDATPPSDLLGRQLGDMARGDRIANENRGRHMEQSNDAKSSSESFNRQPEEVNSAKSTSDLGLQLNENVKQDSLVENNGYDTLDRISVSNHINNQNNNCNNTINNSVNNLNTINNNISAPSKELERLRINNAMIEDGEKGDKEKEFEKADEPETHQPNAPSSNVVRRLKKGNLKTSNSSRAPRRVSFDPLALLLDASLEGELELVKRTATEVPNPSAANDEGITALHNAICAGHLDIVTFLVTFGCDVNAQDSDGWTPLHCAASCNNVAMVRFLVEHGACVLATTLSDHETAAEKCEQDEEGYDGCSQYLYSVQEKLGIMNGGAVYAVYDYDAQNEDELSFKCGDSLTVIRRGDEYEREWWWIRFNDKCGYVPRNLLGLCPRVKNPLKIS